MTAEVPRQPTVEDFDIATVRALVRAGVISPTHRRWREMCRAADALHIRPQDAVYRAHDGAWKDRNDLDNLVRHAQHTVAQNDPAADFSREANTR